MVIKWEEPPVGARGGARRGVWSAVLADLQTRPGDWALIGEDVAASTATYLRTIGNGFEFTLRGVKNNRAEKMYGRYVG